MKPKTCTPYRSGRICCQSKPRAFTKAERAKILAVSLNEAKALILTAEYRGDVALKDCADNILSEIYKVL